MKSAPKIVSNIPVGILAEVVKVAVPFVIDAATKKCPKELQKSAPLYDGQPKTQNI